MNMYEKFDRIPNVTIAVLLFSLFTAAFIGFILMTLGSLTEDDTIECGGGEVPISVVDEDYPITCIDRSIVER